MKKFIVLWLFIIIILILDDCSVTRKNVIVKNTNNISKITVRTQPGNESSLKSTEDKSQITEVVDYINGLDLKKTTKDADQYAGMSYIITAYYIDKTSKEHVHFGNMFFKESGKDWYEVPYDQAVKFEDIYNKLGNK